MFSEITSIALNQTIPPFVAGLTRPETDPARMDDSTVQANFGWMVIDWEAERIDASLRDTETGATLLGLSVSVDGQLESGTVGTSLPGDSAARLCQTGAEEEFRLWVRCHQLRPRFRPVLVGCWQRGP